MLTLDDYDIYFYKMDLKSWILHIIETDYEDYIAPNEQFKCSLLRVDETVYIQIFNENDATVITRTKQEFKDMTTTEIVETILEHLKNYTLNF